MLGYAIVQRQGNDWLNDDCYAAARGFNRIGYDVIPMTVADVEQNKNLFHMDRNVPCYNDDRFLFHGGIHTVRRVLGYLNVKQPEIHNPQDHLPEYCGRNFKETTVGEVLSDKFTPPFFIKPLEDHKLFTGFAVKNFLSYASIENYDEKTKLLYSDYIDIRSEYRCFIQEGSLLGCKNYTGDFTVLPDFDIVKGAIKDYVKAPVAYSLDFAITSDGRTLLLEINDAFALGIYGFNYIKYCLMISHRWDQIVIVKNV